MAEGRADAPARGRRSFWPTVLLGAASAGLVAYAGHHHWVSAGRADPFAPAQQASVDGPATTALALVALAAWGVVLVTRRWVRRGVAVLAGAAAIATVPAAISTRHHLLSTHAGSHANAWPWIAVVAGVLCAAMAVVAVRNAPQWPEMGAKYDAPADAAEATRAARNAEQPPEEQSSLDLWKSLDEGRDPTQDPK